MARENITLTIHDLSLFTKSLRNTLKQHDGLPSHASMLGFVAKAAGYDNYQHLKAAKPTREATPVDRRLARALRIWRDGVMIRWPKQTSVQGLCLWVFWAALPAKKDMTEKEVNDMLSKRHAFGDHALLRRSMIEHRLLQRTTDGSVYRRIEQAPPADAAYLIAAQRPS